MFEFHAIELLSFLKQVGLAVAGASALWGLIVLGGAKRATDSEKKEVCTEVSNKLLLPLALGVLAAGIAWVAIFFVSPGVAAAHEGIVLHTYDYENIKGFGFINILFSLLILYSAIGLGTYRRNPEKFNKRATKFFATELALISVLISIPVWTGNFGVEQIFFFGHNFHSILTFGTVLVLDFIFFTTESSKRIKRQLYPLLPLVSKVIWIGLSMEFLTVSLVFSEALEFTPRFFFMQTVIAILIINGAFLSGPINRKLINSVEGSETGELKGGWKITEGISGVLSISSWTTITFVDSIRNVGVDYWQLILAYAGFILLVYITYRAMERFMPRH